MAKAGGGIVAAFNPLIMPYLLQLRESGNFTAPAMPAIAISIADGDAEPVQSITLMRGTPGTGQLAAVVATAAAGATALSYSDASLTTGGTAYYYAVIVQADGDRIVTSPIWYTRGMATSAVTAQQTLPVDVFPNPANAGQSVTLSYYLAEGQHVRADLHDALGRSVAPVARTQYQPAGPHVLAVPTAGLTPGLYTVRLVADGVATFRKVVIR